MGDRGRKGQKLHIWRNRIETENHWIGVQFRKEGADCRQRTLAGRLVTGDRFMGRHPAMLRCALTGSEQVESIEVQWVGGVKRAIENSLVDRCHLVPSRSVAEQAGRFSLGDRRRLELAQPGQPTFWMPWARFARVSACPKSTLLDGPNGGIRLGGEHPKCLSSQRPINREYRVTRASNRQQDAPRDRAIANGEKRESSPKHDSGWGR